MAISLKGLGARPMQDMLGERQFAGISQPVARLALEAPNFVDRVPVGLVNPIVSPVEAPASGKGQISDSDAEYTVLACGCGCGKEGLLHGELVARDFQGLSTIADESVQVVTVGGSVSGVIDVDGDIDTVTVDLTAGQTISISLRGTGATPLADSFLEVFGTDGTTVIGHDDDGGNDAYSMFTFTAIAAGTYTMEVSGFDDARDLTGGWTVNVNGVGADEGSSVATAVAIGQGEHFGFLRQADGDFASGSAGTQGDYYAVTLEAGTLYTFKLAGGADYETDYLAVPDGEADTMLRILNSGGTSVAFNDDISFPGDISSAISFTPTTTGTYYLRVNGYLDPLQAGYILEFNEINPDDYNPLDSINWFSANNVPFVDVGGTDTAYVYFGAAGETFGEPGVSYGWNQKEMDAVMSALEEYEKILGTNYEVTTDINQATFRLFTTTSTQFGAYFYPQDPVYGGQQGIGAFNVNSGGWDKPGVSTQDIPGDQVSLDKGGFAYAVILHEFGHAHGVAHPHDTGGGSEIMLGVTAPTNSYGLFDLNQGVYTVMSYNDAWDRHPDGGSPFTLAGVGQGWSGTLGAFDIAVLQERYGVLNPTETGDTVYTLSDANVSGTYYECIWDTGGTDTIEYNGAAGNARIDLTAATIDYSPTGGGVLSFVDLDPNPAGVDGVWGGYTIANGVVIENARGGGGADALLGNDVDNVLSGRAGNDTLVGRGGRDKLFGRDGDDAFYLDALDRDDSEKIVDFGDAGAADVLQLDGDAYGLTAGALDPNIFVIGTSAGDSDDRFIYNNALGKLFFDADGNGAGAQVLIAKFNNLAVLDATDFTVV